MLQQLWIVDYDDYEDNHMVFIYDLKMDGVWKVFGYVGFRGKKWGELKKYCKKQSVRDIRIVSLHH